MSISWHPLPPLKKRHVRFEAMPPCNGSSGQAPFLAQAYPVVVLLHDGADHTLVRNDYRTHWFSITLTQGVTYIFYTSAQYTSMQYTNEPSLAFYYSHASGQRSHTSPAVLKKDANPLTIIRISNIFITSVMLGFPIQSMYIFILVPASQGSPFWVACSLVHR